MRPLLLAMFCLAAAAAEPELVNGAWVIPKKDKPAAATAPSAQETRAVKGEPRERPSDIMAGSDAAAQAEKERHEKALADIEQQRKARLGAWAAHARLDQVKVPTMPADPRDSDKAAVREANAMNEAVSMIRQAIDGSHLDGADLGNVVMRAWLRLNDARMARLLDDR